MIDEKVDKKVDKWGFTIKPSITDDELILICLKNAPCGTDRKHVLKVVKRYEEKLTASGGLFQDNFW
jgi:hypothetical protein|tara:strand:- start:164 stop:364 length:201 start_codon:yes stop_codon:yes gene_type:complete